MDNQTKVFVGTKKRNGDLLIKTVDGIQGLNGRNVNDLVEELSELGNNKEDLSGVTGDYDGQIRLDDGTNTANNGLLCIWDESGSAWQPSDGSATFS